MVKHLSRRTVLAALTLAGLSRAVPAQPNPMRLVVPFPAGGTADILPRIVADKLRAAFPGRAIVDNISGAGGNLRAGTVFRAKPDRHSVLALPPRPVDNNHSLDSQLYFYPSLQRSLT